MKRFVIYDENSGECVATIEARDGKSALKKFKQRLISTGMYEIHKTKLENWELSTSYGAYFWAKEDK